ncbi:site-specific DNA-methyltransferase [Marinobacter panjinensis]|uniref:site-specific DNA-methyltransferase (adenine-specific) n=1 Tax=Marinobacter panjinensis TaxID=2576384 RepID=A0A4U6R598_9GAMM|nr:site-specific DNA-methyltransferase [Marinobacter panjinensis]MCR8914242.1 site-specific DNA-methyltransferase [Marinobacter panjinensis]TKV68907.1 site-specific DNA-methyltransferase [Marinobacter panjinensis]
MDKLKMHSPDLSQDNIAKIREMFPGCVTEARDGATGEPRLAVDFDQLRQELSDSIVEGPQERYRLDWPGKRESLVLANEPISMTLRPFEGDSVNFEATRNAFIEGDNLDALKLIQEMFLGQIQMIYIDPPYNTGRDLLYDDDFSEGIEEYQYRSRQVQQEGFKMTANPDEGGRFHSNWLSSLYPRIKICKRLLKSEGVLAISIDDNEISNLLAIVDEIFGWENRKVICVKMSESSGLKMGSVKKYGTIPKLKEYLVLCSKNGISGFEFDGVAKQDWDDEYNIFLKGLDKAGRELISRSVMDGGEKVPIDELDKVAEEVQLQSLSEAFEESGLPANEKKAWCFENSWRICQCATSASVLKLVQEKKKTNDNSVFFVRTASGLTYPVRSNFSESSSKPRVQLIFADDNSTVHPGDMWLDIKTTGLDGEGGVSFKNGKKPLKLLKRILKSKTRPNDIVMDFFAGSGSFGHAVMSANAEDGFNRRFILAQLPEALNVKDDDQKASHDFCSSLGLEPNVAELCKERLRKSGNRVLGENCHPDWNRDVGFRVLKVDSSNMKDIYYRPDELSQGDLLESVDNVKPDRTPEDLLFQVLVDWGVDLTLPIRRETLQGKTVFFVDDNALVACFDTGVTEDLVKELARHEPLRVVFRDNGFVSDAVKINVEQIFRQLSPSTEVRSL